MLGQNFQVVGGPYQKGWQGSGALGTSLPPDLMQLRAAVRLGGTGSYRPN
jgi:hypothetical protein